MRNFLLGKGNTLEGFAAAAAHAVAADTGDGGDRQERGATGFLVGKAEVIALLGAAAPLLLAHELESNHFALWCGVVVLLSDLWIENCETKYWLKKLLSSVVL